MNSRSLRGGNPAYSFSSTCSAGPVLIQELHSCTAPSGLTRRINLALCVFKEWEPLLVACHRRHHHLQRTGLRVVACWGVGPPCLSFCFCYLISNLLQGETLHFNSTVALLSYVLEGKISLWCHIGTEVEGAGAAKFPSGAFQLSWLVYTAHRAPAGRRVLNLLTSQRDKPAVEFEIPPSKWISTPSGIRGSARIDDFDSRDAWLESGCQPAAAPSGASGVKGRMYQLCFCFCFSVGL